MHTHAHMHIQTHAHMHTCTYIHMHTYTYMHMHVDTHAHMHIHTNAYMHIHTHEHMNIQTHVHRSTPSKKPNISNLFETDQYTQDIMAHTNKHTKLIGLSVHPQHRVQVTHSQRIRDCEL